MLSLVPLACVGTGGGAMSGHSSLLNLDGTMNVGT